MLGAPRLGSGPDAFAAREGASVSPFVPLKSVRGTARRFCTIGKRVIRGGQKYHGGQFVRAQLHLAPAETLDIRQAWVGADGDVVAFAGAHGFLHDERVTGVEATGDVGVINHGDEFVVWAAFLGAKWSMLVGIWRMQDERDSRLG